MSRKRKDPPAPAALLSSLAAALNACDRAGLKVRLRHGAVWTNAGWVLPPAVKGQGWVARTPAYTEFPDADDGED